MDKYNVTIDFSSVETQVEARNQDEAIGMVQQMFEDNPDKFHQQVQAAGVGYVEKVEYKE